MAETFQRPTVLRGLSEADLQQQLAQLRRQLWEARVKIKEGALAQTHRVPLLRRHIARIQTVLNEQRRGS